VKEGLPSACVFSMSETADGDLWLGTMRGAARLTRGAAPRVAEVVGEAQGLANELVFRAENGPDGSLWVWSEGGLQRRRPGEERLGPVDDFGAAISADVWGFSFDGDARLWVGSRRTEGGLALLRADGTWRVFDSLPDGTRIGVTHALAPRRAGGVWAAFGARLAACDGETVMPLPAPPAAMSSPYVNKLFEDSKGRLWAASGSGLARLETNGTWTLLTDRLGSPYVYFVGEDRTGTIWVGTTRGVYRLGAGDAVTPFTPDDGLAGWETNINAFHTDRDGVVWIGTVDGLSRYDPASHRPNAHPPRVVVESVRLPGRTVSFPDRLELAWAERSAAFRVAVLSFRSRGRTAYRARLEGLEEGWLPLRREPELRYTNLPAGELKLHVQGINESGLWGEVVTIPIRVDPPFWMTPWFRSVVLLALVAAVAGTFRWRTLVLRRRNQELEGSSRNGRPTSPRRTTTCGTRRERSHASSRRAPRLPRTWRAGPRRSPPTSRARSAPSGSGSGRSGTTTSSPSPTPASPPRGSTTPLLGPGAPRVLPSQDGAVVVPVSGMSSELRGALLVQGPAVVWGETERRLVGGFAHQLGAALDMAHMRRQLSTLREKREATLREMHEQGDRHAPGLPSLRTLLRPGRGGVRRRRLAARHPPPAPLRAPRPLPVRAHPRAGRDGDGLLRPRHAPRARRRHQADPAGALRRLRAEGPLRARGAHDRPDLAPRRHRSLRLGRAPRRHRVPRDGDSARARPFARPPRVRDRHAAPGRPARARGGRGARGRARRRRRPPRHQAGEPLPRGRPGGLPREGPRLRPRQGDGPREGADPHGDGRRDAGVHVARAGARMERRRAHRRLLPRRRLLRGAARPPRDPRRGPGADHGERHRRGAAPRLGRPPRSAAGSVRRPRGGSLEGRFRAAVRRRRLVRGARRGARDDAGRPRPPGDGSASAARSRPGGSA
jgi:Predicted periplasmic ligand-binding sensor domain